MQLNPSVIRASRQLEMTKLLVSIALAANTLMWSAFLLREPLPQAVLDEEDRTNSGRSEGPDAVAGRPVSRGWPHGRETLALRTYQVTSLPGLLLGVGLNEAAWTFLSLRPVGERVKWFWTSSEARSWVLAATLFLGTSAWWATIGYVIGRWKSRQVTGPDNKELERTKSSQTAWGLRRSILC